MIAEGLLMIAAAVALAADTMENSTFAGSWIGSYTSDGTAWMFVESVVPVEGTALDWVEARVFLHPSEDTDDQDIRIRGHGVWNSNLRRCYLATSLSEWQTVSAGVVPSNTTAQFESLFEKSLNDSGQDMSYFDGNLSIVLSESNAPTSLASVSHADARISYGHPYRTFIGTLENKSANTTLTLIMGIISYPSFYSKAATYGYLACFAIAAQMYFTHLQMKLCETEARAQRMSFMTVGLFCLFDSYLSMFHLSIALMFVSIFDVFILASSMLFGLFGLFEMRLFLLVWKAQHPDVFNGERSSLQRRLGQLYLKFYCFVFLGITIFSSFEDYFHLMLFPLYSFYIPQIIHVGSSSCCSPCRTSKPTPEKAFQCHTCCAPTAVVSSLHCVCLWSSDLFIAIDMYGCPNNFLGQEPKYGVCYALSMYVAAQSAVLYIQDTRGPRFFLPASMFPAKYDYHRTVETESLDTCAICMTELLDMESLEAPGNLMVCPCNHVFHGSCLQQWMDHKMECPTCRSRLPPL